MASSDRKARKAAKGLDKTMLLFKVPLQKGRTADQAKYIAAFWARSLQKLVNSLSAVGRLVNGLEQLVLLAQAQLTLRQKMEKSGTCCGSVLLAGVGGSSSSSSSNDTYEQCSSTTRIHDDRARAKCG